MKTLNSKTLLKAIPCHDESLPDTPTAFQGNLQRECLEIMGCHGAGKVFKLAEIIAGTVLAGELSLACAISSLEWVSAHEELGRNR